MTTPPLLSGCKALAVAGQLPTCGLAPCALRGLGPSARRQPRSDVRVGVTAVACVVPLIGTGSAPGRLGGRRKRRLGPARPPGPASAAYRARALDWAAPPPGALGQEAGLQPRRSARTGALRPGLHHAAPLRVPNLSFWVAVHESVTGSGIEVEVQLQLERPRPFGHVQRAACHCGCQ